MTTCHRSNPMSRIPHTLLDTPWCMRHPMVGESSADLAGGAPAIAAWVRLPAITSWTPRARGNLMDGVCTTAITLCYALRRGLEQAWPNKRQN